MDHVAYAAERLIMSTASRACRVCALQIPQAASKCTHCSSWQDWRRHLSFGNTFLALIIALFSVISLGTPLLLNAMRGASSEILVNGLFPAEKGSLILVVTNTGTKPAIIRRLAFRLHFDHMLSGSYSLPWHETRIIPAGDTREYEFSVARYCMVLYLNSQDNEILKTDDRFDGEGPAIVFSLTVQDYGGDSENGYEAGRWTNVFSFFEDVYDITDAEAARTNLQPVACPQGGGW